MNPNLTSLPIEQRWQKQLHPMPSVLAMVRRKELDQERYLMIKRIKEPYTGKWALVGGKWDFGESLDEAICREVFEETGLETRFASLRGVINERMSPESDAVSGGHFLLFVCELVVVDGEATEQAEGAVGWFTLSELKSMHAKQAIVPSDFQIIQYCHEHPKDLHYLEAEITAGKDGLKIDRFDVVG